LDLVGWVTVTPPSGPAAAQLPIHHQILENYNETALLLAFHASDLENMSSAVGKLPVTVFESVHEGETADDGDKSMQIDGQPPTLNLKFRQLPYAIETGEAEMIGVDFVATGGGNASAIPAKGETSTAKEKPAEKGKTKEKGEKDEEATAPDTSPLSREDEDCMHTYPLA
jgi:COP9 signalosome complex subunit 6